MWWWWWLSLQHMGVVLTHRLQHLALADPFLIGSVLAVLVVAAFAVLVAVVATTTDDSPASPRILVGRRAEAAIGGSPCAPGRRPHRAGVRRLRVLTRRPPTVETSYPDNRPIARTPVLRRAKR
jgi:hypothetical protein